MSAHGAELKTGDRAGQPLGYETEDVHVGATYKVIGGLALAVALVIGAIFAMMTLFADRQAAALPPLTALQTKVQVPPAPNLQGNPYRDIDALKADDAKRLEGYAYIDDSRTRARIPIARAMALTVGRSLDP